MTATPNDHETDTGDPSEDTGTGQAAAGPLADIAACELLSAQGAAQLGVGAGEERIVGEARWVCRRVWTLWPSEENHRGNPTLPPRVREFLAEGWLADQELLGRHLSWPAVAGAEACRRAQPGR